MELTQDRTIKIGEEYQFSEADHAHKLLIDGDWKFLYGVSSIVKNITDFGIAAYYGSRRALMELGYDPKMAKSQTESFRNLAKAAKDMSNEVLVEMLQKAYKAHATYSKARATKGTNSHDIIDRWIKKCLEENDGYPIPSIEPKVMEFANLTKHLNPRFVASEKHGYNRELFIGGIADVIVETNIGLGIWDMKDRPAIYDKDLIQMGGYTLLFPMEFTHVMGIPLEGKEPRIFYDVKQLQEVFKHQFEVYKFQEALKPKEK